MAFTIENKLEDGFDKIILKDNESNTSVEILPSCGGILHSFTILHNNKFINVIDNYKSGEDFSNNVTAKGFLSCKLSPFACRIKDAIYTYKEKKYTIQKFLLGKHALHGLIYDAAFDIVTKEATAVQASISLQYEYIGTDAGYPFKYKCIVSYTLRVNNELTVSTDIINTDKEEIPMQDGWHPYFTLGKKIDELQFEFQSKGHWEFDDMIPTGKIIPYEEFGSLKLLGPTRFDDCFTLNFSECQPMCVLRDKENKLQIEIRPDKSYPYLQLYTPDHRNSIAIENLSAPPDAFNNGVSLKILLPNEQVNFTTTYKVTQL